MKIELAWPDRRLSPNARVHWRAKIDPKKEARLAGAWATFTTTGFQEVRKRLSEDDELIPAKITFYPPDKRWRDDDNIIGSFKHARDGISEALGINDRRLRPEYFFGESKKPGSVTVEISVKKKAPNLFESGGLESSDTMITGLSPTNGEAT